ncbi:MAG: ParB N-terminal domain-containing protein [Candidatus Hydrogenedentes bacterium]|nr:ParB N-terminal domain-containing protein [Candidatus Hydrogenedentota bacterium]
MDAIKNRIVKLIRVKGTELRPHPKNPRRHPQNQVSALRGVLEEVGIAGALLVYKANDGILTIIDGECRSKYFADEKWPCLLLDVTDEEADYLLATHDPLAALAGTDAAALQALLETIAPENAAVTAMLAEIAKASGVVVNDVPPDVTFPEIDETCANEVKYVTCPNCGHQWPK